MAPLAALAAAASAADGRLAIGAALGLALLLLAMGCLPPLWRRRRRGALAPGAHVVVTGGSKGIGLALAEECVRRGCSVTVLARDRAGLDAALARLRAAAAEPAARAAGAAGAPKQLLQAYPADTCDSGALASALAAAEGVAGPADVLVCCAGLSVPGLFADQPLADFQRQMDVNYFGAVRAAKAALPGMLARGAGTIVFVSSAVVASSFVGYASYAPTKWALRGLADALRSEVLGRGVAVAVAYPPDTDTPGFAEEERTKPAACRAVNAAVGSRLFPARRVARVIAAGVHRGDYHVGTPDAGTNLMLASMAGLTPAPLPLAARALAAPLLAAAAAVVGRSADRAAARANRAAAAEAAAAAAAAGGE